MRVDGHHAPDSTVLRALRRSGRVKAPSSAGTSPPTQNQRDAIETVEHRPRQRPSGCSAARCSSISTDPETGEIRPDRRSSPITAAASNQPASPRFIERAPRADPHPHPPQEPRPERRPRARLPARLKYEHLYRLEIDDGHDLGLETRDLPAALQPDPTAPITRRADARSTSTSKPVTTRPTLKLTEPETLPLS